MKSSKLLKRLNQLLSSTDTDFQQQRDELSKTLKKLKKKSLELEQAIADCDDLGEKQQLEEKLAILQSKRLKGIKLHKDLNGH